MVFDRTAILTRLIDRDLVNTDQQTTLHLTGREKREENEAGHGEIDARKRCSTKRFHDTTKTGDEN